MEALSSQGPSLVQVHFHSLWGECIRISPRSTGLTDLDLSNSAIPFRGPSLIQEVRIPLALKLFNAEKGSENIIEEKRFSLQGEAMSPPV